MRKSLFTCFAASALMAAAGQANAFETFNIVFDPSSEFTVNVSTTVANYSNQPAGQFTITPLTGSLLAGGSFQSFCVELTQFLANPAVLADQYSVVPTTTQVTAAKIIALEKLYTVVPFPVAISPDDATNGNLSTAFQAAVWEIVYESSDAFYSLTSGNAQFSGGSVVQGPGGLGTAQLWLNQINSNTVGPVTYNLQVLESPTRQDYLVATVVPEPEAYGLALAGMGVVAFAMRRRKADKSA